MVGWTLLVGYIGSMAMYAYSADPLALGFGRLTPPSPIVAPALFPLMLWNRYNREPNTLYTVLVVAAVVVTGELLYFEREYLAAAVERVEPDGVPFPGGTDTGN